VITPDLKTFRSLARKGTHVPLTLELLADLETPVSALLKLTRGFKERRCFLFESVEGGERVGRYSYLGGGDLEALATWDRDPLPVLKARLAAFKPVPLPGLPPFWGGAVGYLGYDGVRHMEPVASHNPDPLGFPESLHFLADAVVAFDHVKHVMTLICLADARDKRPAALGRAYAQAERRLKAMLKLLEGPLPKLPRSRLAAQPRPWSSNVDQATYLKWVARCLEYIKAGDIFQIQVGRRLSKRTWVHPFSIYRELRGLNPSPYMFYLQDGARELIGASPEILVTLQGETVCIRPIAGTRRRGRDDEHDLAMERELKADPKERAEHIMLVDLARNDVGRVCRPGTVKVGELMVIERYSHVLHLVSDVKGRLKEGLDSLDVLRASFPAGTVTGSPKIRAMQIIDELENIKRGPYGGSMGMIGFNGDLMEALTIRTLVMDGPNVHAQASAGIVADSQPKLEYLETENKLRSSVTAVERAEGRARP
jgi:anthranilate synthase component 1